MDMKGAGSRCEVMWLGGQSGGGDDGGRGGGGKTLSVKAMKFHK